MKKINKQQGISDIEFSKALRALGPGKLCVLTGPNESGKTCLARRVAIDLGVTKRKTAIYMPLDGNETKTISQLAQTITGMPDVSIKELEPGVWEKAAEGITDIFNSTLLVSNAVPESVRELARTIKKLAKNQKVAAVIIDNICLLRGGDNKRVYEALKKLATEIKAGILAVSPTYSPERDGEVDTLIALK